MAGSSSACRREPKIVPKAAMKNAVTRDSVKRFSSCNALVIGKSFHSFRIPVMPSLDAEVRTCIYWMRQQREQPELWIDYHHAEGIFTEEFVPAFRELFREHRSPLMAKY